MIYEMGRSLEALMRARNFPVAVVYGPDGLDRIVGANTHVLVVERDREAGDTVGPARGAQRNARRLFTFAIGVRVTVFARSQIPGAHLGDHERECERIVRGLLASLHRWAASERAAPLEFGPCGMVEIEGYEKLPGCKYALQFRVPTGLEDLAYTHEAAGTAGSPSPTTNATGVDNTTALSLVSGDLDPGCGPLPSV